MFSLMNVHNFQLSIYTVLWGILEKNRTGKLYNNE